MYYLIIFGTCSSVNRTHHRLTPATSTKHPDPVSSVNHGETWSSIWLFFAGLGTDRLAGGIWTLLASLSCFTIVLWGVWELALLLFIFWCDQGCTYSMMSYQNNYIFQHVSPWKHLTRSQEEVQSLISYLEPWSVYRSVCVRLIYLLITVMQTYQLCFHFAEGARIWKKSKVI